MPDGSQEQNAASSHTSEKRFNAKRAPKSGGRSAKARTETPVGKGVKFGNVRVAIAKSEQVGRSRSIEKASGRVPTDRQRYLAAEIRVAADKKLKRETPEWIVELAVEGTKKFAS